MSISLSVRRGATLLVMVMIVTAIGAQTAAGVRPSARTAQHGTPNTSNPIDGCTVIDQPGSYQLSRNLTLSNDTPCLEVNASGVSLNGWGYTINGTGSGTGVLVNVAGGATTDIEVSNLTVRDVDHVVRVPVPANASVSGIDITRITAVSIDDDAVTVDINDNGTIENLTVTESAFATNGDGIYVEADEEDVTVRSLRVTDNLIDSDGSTGFDPAGVDVEADEAGVAITRTTIENNTIRAPDLGVDLGFPGGFFGGVATYNVTVARNEITGFETAGISLEPLLMNATTDVRIRGNMIHNEGSDVTGIELGSENGDSPGTATLAIRNNSVRTGGDAIVVDSFETGRIDVIDVSHNALVAPEFGVDNEFDSKVLNATQNYWGAIDGPGSAGPYEDPVTGALANGTGSDVSSGSSATVANVHFDPYLAANPLTDDAGFDVTIETTNSSVEEGETLTVNATVENLGNSEATGTVKLLIRSIERDSTTVTLQPGASTTVTLSWDTAAGDAGNYTATVSTGAINDSVAITVTTSVDVPSGVDPIDECTDIDASGRYALTRNVRESRDVADCIQIKADDVILDGNGYTIDGLDNDGNGIKIGTDSEGASNVTIRDVTVADWDTGIIVDHRISTEIPLRNATFRNVEVRDNVDGMDLQVVNTTLTAITAIDNEDDGVRIDVNGNRTRIDVNASYNGRGVIITKTQDAVGNAPNWTLRDVTAIGNADDGIIVRRDNTTVDGGMAIDNAGWGVRAGNLAAVTFRNITAKRNDGHGVVVGPQPGEGGNDTLVNVTAAHNGGKGINANRNTRLRNVTVVGNAGIGISTENDAWLVNVTVINDEIRQFQDAELGTGTIKADNLVVTGNRSRMTLDLEARNVRIVPVNETVAEPHDLSSVGRYIYVEGLPSDFRQGLAGGKFMEFTVYFEKATEPRNLTIRRIGWSGFDLVGIAPDTHGNTVSANVSEFGLFHASASQPKQPAQSGISRATIPDQPDIPWGGRTLAVDVHPEAPSIALAASESGGLFKTIDGGETWENLGGPSLPHRLSDVKFAPSDPEVVILSAHADSRRLRLGGRVVSGGGIWRSTDGGETWNKPPSAEPPESFACTGNATTQGIAFEPNTTTVYVGTECGLAVSQDLGQTWEHVRIGPDSEEFAVVSVASPAKGIVDVGTINNGHFRYNTTSGSWQDNSLPASFVWNSPSALAASPNDPDVLFAVVEEYDRTCGTEFNISRTLYESNDGGGTWSMVDYPDRCDFNRPPFVVTPPVATNGSFNVFVGNGDDTFRQQDCSVSERPVCENATDAWSKISVDHADQIDIAYSANDTCPLFMANDGGVEKTSDCGASWYNVGSSSNDGGYNALQLYRVQGQIWANHTDLYIGTQDNSIWASPDNGATWPNAHSNEGGWMSMDRYGTDHENETITGEAEAAQFQSKPHLRSPRDWPNPPGIDAGSEGGSKPYFIEPGVYLQWSNETDANATRTLWLTNDTGETWSDIVRIEDPAIRGNPIVGPPDDLTMYVPYHLGSRIGLKKITNIRGPGQANVTTVDEGIGSLAIHVRGQGTFDWHRIVAADPKDPNHLIVVDADAEVMKVSHDGGQTWHVDRELTELITSNGRYEMIYGSGIGTNAERRTRNSQVTAIAFDPVDSSDRILIGTEDNGVIASEDGGETWFHVENSRRMPAITSFFFDDPTGDDSTRDVYVSTYGRGLWRLDLGGYVDSCTRIESPGLYQLAGNITAPADEPCIEINTSDVVLEGNGFTLEGTGGGSADGYPVVSRDFAPEGPLSQDRGHLSNVTVRNMRVVNWSQPVFFNRVDDATARNVSIGNGISLANTDSGVGIEFLGGTDQRVIDSRIRDRPNAGIRVVNASGTGPLRASIVGSTLQNNSAGGIHLVRGEELVVKDNELVGNRYGITSSSGVATVSILNNTVLDSDRSGIELRGPNVSRVTNNLVRGNGAAGVRLEGHVVRFGVVENVIRHNQDGIVLAENTSGTVTVLSNQILDNNETGVMVAAAAAVDPVDVHFNKLTGNAAYGVEDQRGDAIVNATHNWWGDGSGPSSPAGASGNLTDPVTGAVANGTGDTVSENGSNVGGSNVRFDPWISGAFDYANLSVTPQALTVGESLTVTAEVTNTADIELPFTAPLVVDGSIVATETRTLAPGAKTTVTFGAHARVFMETGTYAVTIDSLDPEQITITTREWPQFRAGPAHTGHLDTNGPTRDITVLWNVSTVVPVVSSPAVVNGTVYVGSSEMYALSATDGTEQWSHDFKFVPRVRSSPAVVNGSVYVGGLMINARTGVKEGRYGGKGDDVTPTVVNGIVYSGTSSGKLAAVDAETGALRWSADLGDDVVGSPAVANGTVYAGADPGILYAMDAETGAIRWTRRLEDDDVNAFVRSSPAIANDTLYVGISLLNGNDSLLALDPETGDELWNFSKGRAVESSPAVAGGVVYFGTSAGNVYAVDAETGTVRWNVSTDAPVVSSPAVADGTVYVGTGDLFARRTGDEVYAIDAQTGTVLWNFSTDGPVESSPAVVNGTVYVGSRDGTVYALEGGKEKVPAVVGDRSPTDPDNDGLFEDVNGNGRKDFEDVVTLFERMDSSAVQDFVSAYDFNQNGRIDFDDVVELFEEI